MISTIIIGTIILAILSLILASAWNSFIVLIIDKYIPSVGNEILYTFLYVAILTAIVIFAAAYFIPKFDPEFRGNKGKDTKAREIPEIEKLIRDVE